MTALEALDDACAPALARLDDAGAHALLRSSRIGLEKESLRVDESGYIAHTPHPRALGSALTHPHITTDFSEALMEFVTPPFEDPRDTLRFLEDLHVFTYRHLGRELLWCTSMPCMVGADDTIPIADYGRSNVGTMKRVYRHGLSHRYGRTMQTIAGVHFNYSLPDALWRRVRGTPATRGEAARAVIDDGFFGCVRNFLRFGWLVPLLFGSSPAVCKTFVQGNPGNFESFDAGTFHHPHATSLRMSDIGYTNDTQASLAISYDSLDAYVSSLSAAIDTPYPPYESIGVEVDGEFRQLNANMLQIENEFYSSIRPKQISRSAEKPTAALMRRGVRYLEVRSLDLDPFEPLGVNEITLRVLEALLVLCAVAPSPPLGDEMTAIKRNMREVPKRGRDPNLEIEVSGQYRPVLEQGALLVEALVPVCQLLDAAHGGDHYGKALDVQRQRMADPDLLPSSRVLQDMSSRGVPFFRFAMDHSLAHAEALRTRVLAPARLGLLEEEAARSLEQQRNIESSDRIDFTEYLRRYFGQTLAQRERLLG